MPTKAPTICSRPRCRGIVNDGVCSVCGVEARIPTTIVAGAPGSGKTSFVKERARPGDLILDTDAIFVALSGLEMYNKPDCLLPFVWATRDAILNRLAQNSEAGHAWIITGEPDKDRLRAMRDRLGARLLVMDVDQAECLRRIDGDDRRTDKQMWRPIVEGWFAEFQAKR